MKKIFYFFLIPSLWACEVDPPQYEIKENFPGQWEGRTTTYMVNLETNRQELEFGDFSIDFNADRSGQYLPVGASESLPFTWEYNQVEDSIYLDVEMTPGGEQRRFHFGIYYNLINRQEWNGFANYIRNDSMFRDEYQWRLDRVE